MEYLLGILYLFISFLLVFVGYRLGLWDGKRKRVSEPEKIKKPNTIFSHYTLEELYQVQKNKQDQYNRELNSPKLRKWTRTELEQIQIEIDYRETENGTAHLMEERARRRENIEEFDRAMKVLEAQHLQDKRVRPLER